MTDMKQPAFPQGRKWVDHNGRTGRDIEGGMTLRDWFAGQALVSMGTWMPPSATGKLNADEALRQRADWAYRQADAMMAEKEKRDDR